MIPTFNLTICVANFSLLKLIRFIFSIFLHNCKILAKKIKMGQTLNCKNYTNGFKNKSQSLLEYIKPCTLQFYVVVFLFIPVKIIELKA